MLRALSLVLRPLEIDQANGGMSLTRPLGYLRECITEFLSGIAVPLQTIESVFAKLGGSSIEGWQAFLCIEYSGEGVSTVKHICPGKATLDPEPYNSDVSKEGLGPRLYGFYG